MNRKDRYRYPSPNSDRSQQEKETKKRVRSLPPEQDCSLCGSLEDFWGCTNEFCEYHDEAARPE